MNSINIFCWKKNYTITFIFLVVSSVSVFAFSTPISPLKKSLSGRNLGDGVFFIGRPGSRGNGSRNTSTVRDDHGSSATSSSLSMSYVDVLVGAAPRIGVLASTALYLSPAAAVWRAVRFSDPGDLNPVPLGTMATSTAAWTAYGLAARDPFVTVANVLGCAIAVSYVVGVLPLLGGGGGGERRCDDEDGGGRRRRRRRRLRTMQATVIGGATASLFLWAGLGLSNVRPDAVRWALGIFATSIGIIFTASPLSTIGEVLAKKDSSTILAPLVLAQLINSGVWAIYGVAIRDLFVWGPNTLGLSLVIVQLVLKVLYL